MAVATGGDERGIVLREQQLVDGEGFPFRAGDQLLLFPVPDRDEKAGSGSLDTHKGTVRTEVDGRVGGGTFFPVNKTTFKCLGKSIN